jgi:hypothetical protein
MFKEPGPAHPHDIEKPGSSLESDSVPSIWRAWARELHRLKMETWVAALLEAAGGLTILGAQAIYMSQPLLNRAVSTSELVGVVDLLEEPERARSFANFLREDEPL